MAQHKSAKKRIRRNARRQTLNKSRVSKMRTLTKKVETAISAVDKKAAMAALKAAQPELHRTADKGIIHKKTASRKLSRLSGRIKALA